MNTENSTTISPAVPSPLLLCFCTQKSAQARRHPATRRKTLEDKGKYYHGSPVKSSVAPLASQNGPKGEEEEEEEEEQPIRGTERRVSSVVVWRISQTQASGRTVGAASRRRRPMGDWLVTFGPYVRIADWLRRRSGVPPTVRSDRGALWPP